MNAPTDTQTRATIEPTRQKRSFWDPLEIVERPQIDEHDQQGEKLTRPELPKTKRGRPPARDWEAEVRRFAIWTYGNDCLGQKRTLERYCVERCISKRSFRRARSTFASIT